MRKIAVESTGSGGEGGFRGIGVQALESWRRKTAAWELRRLCTSTSLAVQRDLHGYQEAETSSEHPTDVRPQRFPKGDSTHRGGAGSLLQ